MPNHGLSGVVFVGQRDDLSCAGLLIDDRLLLTLAGLRSDGRLLPFSTMSVRAVDLGGCNVAVVEVQPSDDPPVRFEGRTWGA